MLKRIIANCCLLVSCLLFFSVSCGQEKLPETEIEKIRFAFNGVERSFSVVGKPSASSEECSSLASKTIEQGADRYFTNACTRARGKRFPRRIGIRPAAYDSVSVSEGFV